MQSWSFSKLMAYEKCPSKIDFKYIRRIPEKSSPASYKGEEIHLSAEKYVLGETKVLHKAFDKFKDELLALRKNKAICELEMAVTREWIPTEYRSADAWLRLKPDVMYVERRTYLRVIDYKSGKHQSPDHNEQLELYAVAGLIKFTDVQTVLPEIYYLQHGIIQECRSVQRSDLEMLKDKWEDRVRPMFNDNRFAPRPGPYCKWCAYSSTYGDGDGPCQY